jgi:hypothetical protein
VSGEVVVDGHGAECVGVWGVVLVTGDEEEEGGGVDLEQAREVGGLEAGG